MKASMGRFFQNALAARRSLVEQWQRTVLSAVGVMVAMIAILLLIGIARGVREDLTKQVKQLGVNVVIVLPARIDPNSFATNPNLGGQSYLKPKHAQELSTEPGVVRAAKMTFAGGGIKHGKEEAYPILIAADPEWFGMHPTELQEGSLYTTATQDEPVCVVGSIAKKALFGEKRGVGETVQMNGQHYRIIGVTKDAEAESSLFSMGSFQNVVYIPWNNFRARNPSSQIDRIMVQTDPETEPKALRERLEVRLGKSLDTQQYSVLTQDELLGLVYKLMSILTWLLTGLTSIALFVGGVGIMAIMLMSVGERTKEIGVRKTVGADQRDIFQQFLCESVLVALLGGTAGILISALVSATLARYTAIKPEFTWPLIGFGLAVCLTVGVVFGLIPATKAARKSPVDAIRLE